MTSQNINLIVHMKMFEIDENGKTCSLILDTKKNKKIWQ